MTELNLAYGFSDDDLMPSVPTQKQQPQQQHQQQAPPQQIQQPVQIPQQQMPQLDPNVYQQPNQVAGGGRKAAVVNNYSYSFWDRMVGTRGDVIKLAVFSLVIVLGISFDRIATYYITKYLTDTEFSNLQEFLIRLSYPILVFIILWIIKSL